MKDKDDRDQNCSAAPNRLPHLPPVASSLEVFSSLYPNSLGWSTIIPFDTRRAFRVPYAHRIQRNQRFIDASRARSTDDALSALCPKRAQMDWLETVDEVQKQCDRYAGCSASIVAQTRLHVTRLSRKPLGKK